MAEYLLDDHWIFDAGDDPDRAFALLAFRYAELTDDAVAVIVSTGSTIDYCFLSSAMKTSPNLDWLRKGSPVPTHTETYSFNNNPENIGRTTRAEAELDVRYWLGGTQKAIVMEEVVGLGIYGKTLTVLSSPNSGREDETDEDEQEQLEESWTPKFR